MSEDEIVKRCSKHGDLKRSDLKTGIYRGKQYRKCKHCELDRSRKYRANVLLDEQKHEKMKEKDRNYWAQRKAEISERRRSPEALQKRREWHNKEENRERYNEKYRVRQRQYREELSDTYVRRIIQNGDKNIKFCAITQSMIEFKRSLIGLKRGITLQRKIKGEK